MDKKITYGLKTFAPAETVFFQDYTSTVRLEASLSVGESEGKDGKTQQFKKFKFLFQQLEKVNGTNAKKQKCAIDYYIDESVITQFIHFVKNGRYGALAQKDLKAAADAAKAGKTHVSQKFFSVNGGTMPERLKGKRKGAAEYREFKLSRATVNDQYFTSTNDKERARAKDVKFLLSVMACDGKVEEQGGGKKLIKAIYTNGKPQNATTIHFPLTYAQLLALAYAIERELISYRTSQYVLAEMLKLMSSIKESKPATVKEEVNPQESVVETETEVTEEIYADVTDEIDELDALWANE